MGSVRTLPNGALIAAVITMTFCGLCLAPGTVGLPDASHVFKMAASLSFLVTAWLAGARHSAYGVILFVGLVCSSFGDYFLLSGGDGRFLAGLVAFLLAHITYCVAYIVRGVRMRTFLPASVAMVIVAWAVIRWVWPHVPDELRMPVAAYSSVISVMVALAAGGVQRPGGVLILLGAVMFYISDIFVARQQFVSPGFANALLGLPLYFGGQAVLALSIALVNARAVKFTGLASPHDQ